MSIPPALGPTIFSVLSAIGEGIRSKDDVAAFQRRLIVATIPRASKAARDAILRALAEKD